MALLLLRGIVPCGVGMGRGILWRCVFLRARVGCGGEIAHGGGFCCGGRCEVGHEWRAYWV